MQVTQLNKKKESNIELLFLYMKLLDLEESCFTQCLRFQKTQSFSNFQKNYSVPRVINVRLDDLIYLLLLAIMEIIFGVLPLDSNNSYTTPYRQSLALFFLTSFIAMVSPHWFRWVALLTFCIAYPTLIYLTVNGYLSLMPFDTNVNIFNYLGYLSLGPIFVLLLLIYPMKQFIRNSVGSIYSYVYGLATTLILYLWPFYSFIRQISNTGSLTYSFITQNMALIVAFIILLITGFYFFIHNSLFQPKLETIKILLLQEFKQGQLPALVEEVEEARLEEDSCVYRNFHSYVRIMSFMIYGITIGLEIFLYTKIVDNTSNITKLALIMAYIIIFLLFGAFLIYINLPPTLILPIIAILSLATAIPSLFYYSNTFNYYQYIFISLTGPFAVIFWSIIKNISPKTLIFRTNVILLFYLMVFLPAILLMMNSFAIFTSDSQIISFFNYLLVIIIIGTLALALVLFVVFQVRKHKIDEAKQDKAKVPVDYTYFEEGNPPYVPYEIFQDYGVDFLAKIDLRDIGYVAGLCFFVFSQVLSIHAVNLLRVDFANTTFYSQSIKQIIYSQFFIILMFYIYTHCYLSFRQSQYIKYIFVITFSLVAFTTLLIGFLISSGATTFKIIGGFAVVMILILIAIQTIKSIADKIFCFVSPILIIALWLFIIIPYVQIIPFGSLFADQTRFGIYIYVCILGSVVLLIILVSVLSLIFNRLIDKYEAQKKYKFVMEEVITLLEEEGIQSKDDQLHILYQSFMYRDKKYVFFLKRGFPLNLLKDPKDNITKLVTSQVYALERIPTQKLFDEEEQKKRSLLWACLTCCCGQDDEEIDQKIDKAKKLIDKEEMESLMPKSKTSGLIEHSRGKIIQGKSKKKWKNPGKTNSSKSLILKDLHSGPRYLGDEYILLRTGRNGDIGVELWHNIFDFAANEDYGEPMIIYNDFQSLCQTVNANIPTDEIDKIFTGCATRTWGQHSGMDLQNFSLAVQRLAAQIYEDNSQETKYTLLTDTFFYNLAVYQQFNSLMIEKKTKDRVTRSQIKNSPFQQSFRKYKQFLNSKKQEEGEYAKRFNKFNSKKLVTLQQYQHKKDNVEQQAQVERGPSCKRMLYDKIKACQNCCKSDQDKGDFQRKLFVRAWPIVSVDSVKIMQKKQIDWDNVAQQTQHSFRCTFNNLVMGGVKLLDIFTYVSLSILNPKIGWLEGLSNSNIFINYSVQVFIAVGVVAISVPFGIKGIMLIFQDRLGLTENRLPAAFPHPMFFFTVLYKLIILALFNIVSQTFLSTFSCNWIQNQPYTLIQDTSIVCFDSYHNWMIIVSLACLIAYYPLSSYAMPNFQFAQKSLDLKFKPSYLIFYFQVNFILLAGKVLLSSTTTSTTLQIVFNSINIAVLSFLGLSVVYTKPCFVMWFNWVELTVIIIGIVVNTMGLVLFLTRQWTLCVILASSLCGAALLVLIVVIKKGYFSRQMDDQKKSEDQYKQLEMIWTNKQKRQKFLISFQENGLKKRKRQIINKPAQDSDEQNTQQMLFP